MIILQTFYAATDASERQRETTAFYYHKIVLFQNFQHLPLHFKYYKNRNERPKYLLVISRQHKSRLYR